MSEFDELVSHALPFARQCCDCDAITDEIAKWCDESGEPALYISATKDRLEPKRFPISLAFYHMNPETRQSTFITSFDITRPEYKHNEFGFQGNHVVVALLREIQDLLRKKVRLPVETFTSQSGWSEFCRGPGYFALKEQRALDYAVPENHPEPTAPRRSRSL